MPDISKRFVSKALENPCNSEILARLPSLMLPDAWLVAGCLFQTVWNLQTKQAPVAHIKDYGVFYFDPSDLSENAEHAVQRKAKILFEDLPVHVEVKNQARVHLWYADYFGFPYAQLASSQGGIDRFLIRCTRVGLQGQPSRSAHSARLYAPDGLDDLYAGILRPNPLCNHQSLFLAKAKSYQQRWPWLTIPNE